MRYSKSWGWGVLTAASILLDIYGLPGMVKNRCLWREVLGSMDTTLFSWAPILLGTTFTLYFLIREGRAAVPILDMPFEVAIQQRLSVQPSHIAHENDAVAERLAAIDIHKLACKGTIRIGGEAHKRTHPMRIKPRKLRSLQPYDCATPRGHVWILGPIKPELQEFSRDEDAGSYWGLRVDSRDIYKQWRKRSKP